AKVIRWHPEYIKYESFFPGVEASNPSISSFPHLTPREIYWDLFCDDPALKGYDRPGNDRTEDDSVMYVGAMHDGCFHEDFSVMREDLPSRIAFGSVLDNESGLHDWWINAGIPEWMIARFGKRLILKTLRQTDDQDLSLVLSGSFQKTVEDIRMSLEKWGVCPKNLGVWDETNPLFMSYFEFINRACLFVINRELLPEINPFINGEDVFLSHDEHRLIAFQAAAVNKLRQYLDDFPSSNTVSRTEFGNRMGISGENLDYVCGLMFENPTDEQLILNIEAEETLLHTAEYLKSRRIINGAETFIDALTEGRNSIFPYTQILCDMAHLIALSHDRAALYYSVLS
ncbi:MAG: hypothetical protein AABZ57_03045, partial [Candidatus Margulisiibacteriota bacterium]